VAVRVAVAGAPARAHAARFEHAVHRSAACTACHATAVTLAPAAAVASCTACHDRHHAAGRRCAVCHATDSEEVREAHAPPERAHLACDACHAAGTVVRLLPDRAFCSTCHAERGDHYAARECTVCHFQMTPETLKPLLAEQGSDST